MAVKASYSYYSGSIPITVTIESNENEFVLIYNISIASISKTTEILLDKIRNEVITKVGVKIEDITDPKKSEFVQGKFKDAINYLLTRYLPGLADKTKDFLITYLVQKSLGLGKIELLLDDINLEEIVINNASEPVWVYHHKLGWLKTNIYLENEEQIKHYSALIGRKVGRSITLLTPLLDAHLETGERVNATLNPISTKGNTITLRKFNVKPITITNMLQENTISLDAASLIWAGIEFELSALVAGGTATGKCVTGDTKIILANGEIKQIKDIVEDELRDVSFKAIDGHYGIPKNLEILSMNKENKIVKSKVNYVWKKKSDKILKILTRDGREIKTTPEHPFFTLENCDIKEIRADKLEPGIKVACARRLPNLDYDNKLNIATNLKNSKIAYSSGGRNPTINTLSKLSCSLEDNCNEILLDKLNLIINSDVYWDEIVFIQEVMNENEFVYDLTVDNHNFIIDNGLIAHNTILLSAICSFFPPNQRIISIEDTREINLAKYLHWIPMTTREPNVEGKGEIAMLDLIINSLRMRPDRIVVGEIRRQREAETLFEAMHTGHSVYATLHANDTEETINRLINPPINVPKSSLPAISMVIIMYRNRRTGIRRVFQISEIEKDSTARVIMQYDLRSDKISKINKSSRLIPELQLQTGLTEQEINNDLKEKSLILAWLAKKNIDSVDEIGKVVATYYRDKEKIMRMIRNG